MNIKRKVANDKRFNPCKCLICGRVCNLLTHAHAEDHGYKTAQEMIKAGRVEWMTDRRTVSAYGYAPRSQKGKAG